MQQLAELHDAAAPAASGAAGPLRQLLRNVLPFVIVGATWEAVAYSGLFPPQVFPALETIGGAFMRLTLSGVLPHHALDTLLRLIAGFVLAALFGVIIGILMGRSRRAEDYLLPLISIGRRFRVSLTRRCFCCGSGRATCRRCFWSRSFPPSRSSIILDRGESRQRHLGALRARHGR